MRQVLDPSRLARSLCAALALGLCSSPVPAAPQQGGEAPPEAVEAPLPVQQVTDRLAELELEAEKEIEVPEALVDVYKEILSRLDAARSYGERTAAYRQAIASAPAEAARIRAELARERGALGEERPAGVSANELQQQLTQLQVELAAARARQAELVRRIAEETARPAQAREQLAAAREVLAQIEADAGTVEPAPDAPEIDRARHWLLRARREARLAEIGMLEQEVLSNAARVDLLEARRDAGAAEIARSESRATQLEQWISRRRQEEAEAARRQAERLRNEATGKHPLIQELAASIAETTRELERTVPRIDEARGQREGLEARLSETDQNYEETQRSLEMGITRSLGAVLLEQRRQLPNPSEHRRAAAERSSRMGEQRLKIFQLERELRGLADPSRRLAELMADPSTEGLGDAERADLESELRGLLETKRSSLDLLLRARRDYLRALGELETRDAELLTRASELATILDERLLWIPNAAPLGASLFGRLRPDLEWLLAPGQWVDAGRTIQADARKPFSGHALAVLAVLVALANRRRILTRLEAIAGMVDKVRQDAIRLSLEALLLHLLLVLPVPLFLTFEGWRLAAAAQASESTKVIGASLQVAALTAAVLLFVRDLQRRNGLAPAHFGWPQRSSQVLRPNLLWFATLIVPAAFVLALVGQQSDPLLRHGLGRLVFLATMIASSVLALRVLHPVRGIVPVSALRSASHFVRRTRPFWRAFGFLTPLVLGAMAAAGYYYAAQQLQTRLIETLLIVLAALYAHAFLMRWLRVSQRRLSMRVALEKRAALLKSREAMGEETGEVVVEVSDEVDVAEIKEQTQDLLRFFVGFGLVVALWFAWVGVLPALGVLDEVTLWSHKVTVTVDGAVKEVENPITLASLGLALLLIAMTVTAARNMPGLLEIAVLQRLRVEPGARYATRTLVLYGIVTTGVVLAFNTIGVGWSSVQWLVAALTVGLGFGLQEIFANFVSGLIILLERPVRVGDTVTVGETSGVVSRIRMRATTITDWKRRELVVPNKNFITGELINWSLSDPILRMEFVVGIAYGSDTARAHRSMLTVCREHPLVLEQPEPSVFFVGFGDNSLNFEVRVFVSETSNTGRTRILHDLHMAIDQACRENDITIAFPQRDLHLKSVEAVLEVRLQDTRRGEAEPRG